MRPLIGTGWRTWPASAAAGRRARRALLVLLALVALLSAGPAHAQLAPDSARLALKVDVVQLLRGAYRAEAEYRWTRRLSLVVAPHLWRGRVSGLVSRAAYEAGDEVRGAGGSLGSRYYFLDKGTEGALLAGWYLGLRADYQHQRLLRDAESWGEDLAANGLYYYTFRRRQTTETIRRRGGTASLGFQGQVLHPRLRLDAGVNLHQLRSRSSAAQASLYRTARTDFGYSGFFWSLNVGLGFVVK